MINPAKNFVSTSQIKSAPASQPVVTKAAIQPAAVTEDQSVPSFGSDQLKSNIPKGLRNISVTHLNEARERLQGRDYIPGELFVKLKPSSSGLGHSEFAAKFGVQVLESLEVPKELSTKFGGELVRVKLPDGLDAPETMAALKGDRRVLYSEVNDRLPAKASAFEADREMEKAWGFVNSQVRTGGPVIAILDSGMDFVHEDLPDNLWTNPGEIAGNGVDDDRNGFVDDVHGYNFVDNNCDITDRSSQGTHVAGTIAGLYLDKGRESNPHPLMSVKVFDQNGETDAAQVVKGMLYALKMGARVTSNEHLSASPNRVFLDLQSLTGQSLTSSGKD